MRIADLPSELRPRERLLAMGANTLDDCELLAILLRTGTSGMSAVDLARDLLARFGSLGKLLAAAPSDLQGIRGLGEAKRAELLAINELQQRSLEQLLQDRVVMDSALAVSRYLRHRFNGLQQECFIGLFTDVRHRLIACEALATGTLDRAHVYPREVVRLALKHNAAAVVFAHNHPGGRAEPSEGDKAMTKKLKQVMSCIEVDLLDHLIVTPTETWSFRDHGLC